jgi:Zn finger protein HypA/HybF involved in hydrogenase expression
MMASMSTDTDLSVLETPLDFICPRCEQQVQATYYGPCGSCRSELRSTLGGESRDVEAVAYEPKMNVVPNQVATKE